MSSQIFFDELSKNKKVSEIFLNFLRWLVFGCKASNTALSTETDEVMKKACVDTAQQTPIADKCLKCSPVRLRKWSFNLNVHIREQMSNE